VRIQKKLFGMVNIDISVIPGYRSAFECLRENRNKIKQYLSYL
jgi:hypothetical protein